ncbi:serine hydrolase domain-containing protein [Aquibacillus kalidii]|uniref:serine hydrolase domain-containing protein n=1 Tax=Aquibacillus kalidii TaxID=2762597 RepID=UPI00164515E7|nr:serine hydrolase domain-containing protein [Aquibacillus kalidii]
MLDQFVTDKMKTVLKRAIENKELAGANLLILNGGRETFYHADGFADIEKKTPINRDSIFRLYSLTKPITATAVMILLERGEIDLYEPVSNFLEGFKNQLVEVGGELTPVDREVTIKDLLSMTSGLVYGGEHRGGKETEALFKELDNRLLGDSPMGTLEFINQLGENKLAFHPGASWEYGTSADVLGAVIEVVSGKRFGDFLYEEIFNPLNMKDTAFWLPEEKRSRLAKTYAEDGNGGLKLYTGNHLGIVHQMDRDPAFESGGAGLVSTIDDYARFVSMLINEGSLDGTQILHPKTVKFLTSSTLNTVQQENFAWDTLSGYSYGNLMRVMTDSKQAGDLGSVGEYGWDGWLGAYFCNSPKDDLTFLLMMQRTDAGITTLTRKLRNIVYSNY